MSANGVNVSILDREYPIGCRPEEREGLIEAARYLDGKMREVRGGNRLLATDRVAILAALNIAHELLVLRSASQGNDKAIADEVMAMRAKLTDALAAVSK
jgi:cell division protein ZapA